MTASLILCLALAAAPQPTSAPFFQRDIQAEEMKRQIGYINADVTLLRGRIDKLETSIGSIQAGLINKTDNVGGSQILTGDVGMIAIASVSVVVLLFLWMVLHYRNQLAIHKQASLILASTHNDDEAKEKATVAPKKIKQQVDQILKEKNGNGTQEHK